MRAIVALRALSSRDQRAIRRGLIVAGPVLVYALVARPYVVDVRRKLDALREQTALLAREEDIVLAPRTHRADSLAADTNVLRMSARLYSAADTTLPAIAFGRDVADALKNAGLVVQRVEMRDSVGRLPGLQALSIDVRAQGGFDEILRALADLEANARLMHVVRLSIERPLASAESLSFVATVRGYAW
jgi:hypothetical protein